MRSAHIFDAHYAFFAARHVDWPALIAAAREKVTANMSQADLLHAVGALLAHIDDDHVTLAADIAADGSSAIPGEAKTARGRAARLPARSNRRRTLRSRGCRSRSGIGQDADGLLGETAHTTANGNIKYGLIGGDIGYLSLLSMEDFDAGDADEAALNEALDEAMELFEGAKAVIVDVSLNDGGEDRLARAIAARFAAKRTLAYSKYRRRCAGSAAAADLCGAQQPAALHRPRLPADQQRHRERR